ncbi:MAG: AAA family ATPase [Micrococcus sp.]|nr:AAA family ATPase [Micrococcus sp.]
MTQQVTDREAAVAQEREKVALRYARLDALRAEKERQLARVRATGLQGSLQNHSERDAFASLYENRLAQLYAVDDRLVFGRLDLEPGAASEDDAEAQRYIGRIGLNDEDQGRLLLDWRAPEAGAFYQATPLHRQGVRRRRHLMLRGRQVRDIEDEILDPGLLEGQPVTAGAPSALLAAVTARRTGRMGDIVATIQAEQDALIRSPLSGAVVVQGGPGTGKTAVALHRAAYLLYTHRERFAASGVLIVGPNAGFMRYIERVLPSLGETGVVMQSVATLYPGLTAVPETDPRVAQLKGRLDAAELVRGGVAQRQRLLPAPRTVLVDGTTLELSPGLVRRARDKARATGKPHNEARATFVKIVVRELAEQLRQHLERSTGASVNRDHLLEDVRSSRDVRVALNLCWMPMTPQRLLTELYTREASLHAAARWLSPAERELLRRDPDAPWTEADVPLLDEAAELLGELPSARPEDGATQHRRDLENAEAALANVNQTLADIGADGVVDAEMLAGLNTPQATRQSTAEQAATDRTWTFGHVVVDEAQELSPMQWRLLARRCPLKSFTIVGDIAQASALEAHPTWAAALDGVFGDRWRLEELTVNYRSPERIMRRAAAVARSAGVDAAQPQAVREGDHEPVVLVQQGGDLAAMIDAQAAAQLELLPEGLNAVIVPAAHLEATWQRLRAAFGERVDRVPAPGVRLVVATPRETKGLEFDGVVIAAPEEIVAEARGVVGDLYVSMTRSTQALSVVSTTSAERLPAGLLGD